MALTPKELRDQLEVRVESAARNRDEAVEQHGPNSPHARRAELLCDLFETARLALVAAVEANSAPLAVAS